MSDDIRHPTTISSELGSWEERMHARHGQSSQPRYGDLGAHFSDPTICHNCYGDQLVWVGNGWRILHRAPLVDCACDCHTNEVWTADAKNSS